ncbi:Zn-dependent metalloprotease [Dyella sp. SG562]|nr:M4 family metallopeptidase [Dyella sp. SG562]NII72348.1 Zn-dependent metalloprotease [Dyella sp. SG562]
MSLKPYVLSLSIAAALTVAGGAQAARFDHLAIAGVAKGLAKQQPAALQADSDDTFEATDVIVDPDGTEHVRMQRSYRGLPVIGGDVVVHSNNGRFREASLTLRGRGRPSLSPRTTADEAQLAAGKDFNGEIESIESRGLVIYARGAKPVLAYEVNVQGASDTFGTANMRYFVDASSGKVLDRWNLFQTIAANGTGKSLLVGNVGIVTNSVNGGYQLIDPSRGNGSVYDAQGKNDTSANLRNATLFTDTDNTWGNNAESDRATVAGDIAYGVSKTWDYYKNVHGRNGIFNDGKGVKSYAHVKINVGGGSYTSNNAAWNGSAMEYGDGGTTWFPLVAVDVAGHEMSHGVTQATAGLAYSGESGGLNEANSDIFGTMVEYYANNGTDAPDYLIGEKIYRSNPNGTTALRYMFKPSLDGASADCWSSSVGSLNVHYSSGVGNHFFYLLAEGAVVPAGFGAGSSANLTAAKLVCNGNTAAGGIGRDAAQKIWYRALTVYMTSNTNYAAARTATLKAAADLYGTTSTQYAGVASAWSAVSVN